MVKKTKPEQLTVAEQDSPASAKPAPSLRRKTRISMNLFLVLLLLPSLGLSIYNLLTTKHLQQNLQTTYTQQATELKQQLNDFNMLLSQQQTTLAQTQQQLATLSKHKSQEQWQLQEISHLIRLADLNLKYLTEPKAVLAILQTADLQLAQLNQPQFDKFRQLLARDMASIRALQTVDIAGTLATLQALATQTLSLSDLGKITTSSPTLDPPSQTTTSINSGWQSIWQQISQTLKHLVIIRHYNQAAHPLVTQEQKQLVSLLIQMRLTQAEWAVLHRNQTLFQQNLQAVSELVQINFSPTAQKTAFLASLAELQKIQLITLPIDLSNTLAAILALLNTTRPLDEPTSQPPAKQQPNIIRQESSLI